MSCWASQLVKLWHFDPWWLLRDPKYQNGSFLNELKSTNCVDQFYEKAKTVFFRADLKRLTWVTRKTSNGDAMNRFTSSDLPLRRPSQFHVSRDLETGWMLNPFWQRQQELS